MFFSLETFSEGIKMCLQPGHVWLSIGPCGVATVIVIYTSSCHIIVISLSYLCHIFVTSAQCHCLTPSYLGLRNVEKISSQQSTIIFSSYIFPRFAWPHNPHLGGDGVNNNNNFTFSGTMKTIRYLA